RGARSSAPAPRRTLRPVHNMSAGGPPLRVVTLVDHVEGGGAERLALALACGLDPTRFRSVVCASREPPRRPMPELRAAGVGFLGLDRRAKIEIWAWRPLLRLLRQVRVDVLHAHMFGSNVWGAVFGRVAGVPVVIATEHGWSRAGQPHRRILD